MTPGQRPLNAPEMASQVEIACPQCRAVYQVSTALEGRRFQCRKCEHVWRWGQKRVTQRPALSAASDSKIRPLSDDIPTAGLASSSVIDTSWAGRRLGRYRLETILGRGGMGVVWRAHDPTLRRDVAIKILNQPSDRAAPSTLSHQLFLQEARAAAKLNHPGAVTVFEISEDAGYYFIAMELMHGGTLKDRLDREGPFEPAELFRLMAAPARALALAHNRGIIHRDIKPGNLMFDDHGHLKLGDFGLSDVTGDPASVRLRGRAVGSLGWIAPETARGDPATPASEIYAFGLVLLYALTGRPWLTADNRSALMALHQNPPQPDFTGIPGLTEDGRALLHRCLQKNPADRFGSAEELATFLEHCAKEPDETIIPLSQVRRSRRMVALAVAVTAVLVVAACVVVVAWYLGLTMEALRRPLQPLRAPLAAPAPGPEIDDAPGGTFDRESAPRGVAWPGHVDESTLYLIASRNGQVYHRPNCPRGGREILLANLVNFPSRAAAEASGRASCPHCRPDLGTATREAVPR